MKFIALASTLTIANFIGLSQFCQAGPSNQQAKPVFHSRLASNVDTEPILRGVENGSPFTNQPAQPNSSGEIKPEAVPGADAVMTQDMLLVSPKAETGVKAPRPLQAFVGQSLSLKIEKNDIVLNGLQGTMISVVNDTNRPLVLDGDTARATVGDQVYNCTTLVALQKCVLPLHGGRQMVEGIFTKLLPAAATVGLEPTIKDAIRMKQPIRMRYGPDEIRRLVEQSRFGERILWPHQKTEGVVYFDGKESLTGAQIVIPVHTLFDPTDTTLLSGNL